jgi:hypothetical protein
MMLTALAMGLLLALSVAAGPTLSFTSGTSEFEVYAGHDISWEGTLTSGSSANFYFSVPLKDIGTGTVDDIVLTVYQNPAVEDANNVMSTMTVTASSITTSFVTEYFFTGMNSITGSGTDFLLVLSRWVDF